MTWFRVDDGFWCHPKVERLEEDYGSQTHAQAVALWVIAGSFLSRHSSTEITIVKLRKLVPWSPVRAAKALVGVGLWERTEAGYRYHDWQDYVSAKRAAKLGTTSEEPENNLGTTSEQPENNLGDRPAESHEKTNTPDPVPVPVPVPVPTAAGSDPAATNYEAARKAAESALRVAIRNEVQRVTGSWPSGLQLDYARQLSGWLVSWMSCESCPRSASMEDVAAGVLYTFAEAKRRDRKMPPFSWLAEAPATWAERWVEETGRRRTEQRKDRKRRELEERKREQERKAEAEAVPPPPEFAAVLDKFAASFGAMPGSAPIDLAERQRRLREQAERLAAGGDHE